MPPQPIEAARLRAPLHRAARPEDVAAAVAFLPSEDARHVIGGAVRLGQGVDAGRLTISAQRSRPLREGAARAA